MALDNQQFEDDGADLRELERMAAGLEQDSAINEEEAGGEGVSPEMQAYGLARVICEMAAKGANLRWSYLEYTDSVKDQGAQVLVPVMLKYDMQSEFFDTWKEELAAGAFFAGLIYTSYAKIKAHEAEEKARKDAEEKAVNA